MLLLIEKCILQDGRVIPANGDYKAKTQITVITDKTTFHLQSETLDLSLHPTLEPCKLEATVTRFGGAKGFFVATVSAVSVVPLVKSK